MNDKLKRFLKSSNKEKMAKINRYLQRKNINLKKEKSYIPTAYGKKDLKFYGPKVSVLLPIYNHANIALNSINSILNQTYKNIELIILNDGSTDNLLEILKPYYNLENVKIYTQKNQKLPRALTHLHRYATGDFITWTSADNVMEPQMIEVLVKKMLENPSSALVYGDVCVIDDKGRPFYGAYRDFDRDLKNPNIIRLLRNEKPLQLANDNYVNACFLYRANDSKILKGIYADDIIGAEDYDYWLRLSKSGDITHIKEPKPYYSYRVHENSMSYELISKKLKQHQSRLANLEKYENERRKWCEKRPNLVFDSSIKKDNEIYEIANKLAVDINNKNAEKSIIFSNKKLKKLYIKLSDNFYYLIDNDKEIIKIFIGYNVPKQAYKARNLYSHSYYVDELYNLKKPIFGCHVNSQTIDIKDIKEILAKNLFGYIVIIDETFREDIADLKNNYSNFIYFSNKEFGKCFEIYSNFARIITLKSFDDNDKYRNILLAYAIGRKINYNQEEKLYTIYPYTIPYDNYSLEFYSNDVLSDDDYTIMDRYLDEMNQYNSLNKIIKYYNSYTQEMFVKRPKYDVDFIPKEDEPKKIN